MKATLKRVLLRALAGITDRVWAQRGSILCLHSVRDRPTSALGFQPLRHLGVSPDFLEELIRDLRLHGFALVSLSDAVRRMQRAEDAGRFVALTFDDGYADNYTTAMPVLTRLGVPFTVFLTSGFLDRAVPMWWVGLEAILSQQDRLNLPERTLPARTTAEKMAAFAVAEQIIRRLPRKELACFCASVFNLNPRARPGGVACAAALDWDQARAMARTGLVSFGCHTLSHPVLAWLDPIRCKSEIATARDRIVEELGLMPEFFAYPYGGSEEVGVHAPKLVAECGFRAAFTTSRRLLVSPLRDADLYALPRLVLDSEDLALTRTHISGLAWALRDIGARMRWPAGAAKAPQS